MKILEDIVLDMEQKILKKRGGHEDVNGVKLVTMTNCLFQWVYSEGYNSYVNGNKD